MSGSLLSRYVFLLLVSACFWRTESDDESEYGELKCDGLLIGQYKCSEPEIDPTTQSAKGCTKHHTVEVKCHTVQGLTCRSTNENQTEFTRNVPCRHTNGHSYETALLLSIFLGMFGIDRFYLGYPAVGLLKFCTLGFFFIFQLVDILLIATQIVGPADGSDYVIDYYGPRLIHIEQNNETFYRPS